MQLTRETADANVIRAWKDGALRIGERWFDKPVIIASDRIIDWAVTGPTDLGFEHLEPAVALNPEIILLGTGTQAVFPDLSVHLALAERRIGLEVMNTPAACRTFNILLSEGRCVVAALLIGSESAGPGSHV